LNAFASVIAHLHNAEEAGEEFAKAVNPLGDSRIRLSFVRLGMRPSQRPCLGLRPPACTPCADPPDLRTLYTRVCVKPTSPRRQAHARETDTCRRLAHVSCLDRIRRCGGWWPSTRAITGSAVVSRGSPRRWARRWAGFRRSSDHFRKMRRYPPATKADTSARMRGKRSPPGYAR
jgi:hypothetical protein